MVDAPAMVCMHGTNGGNGGIVGVKGSYGKYGDYYGAHGDDPGMHYGLELAMRGFVTISPDYIFLATRTSDDEPARLQELGHIVAQVQHPLVIDRFAGVHHVVRYSLAVYAQVEAADSAGIGPCAYNW